MFEVGALAILVFEESEVFWVVTVLTSSRIFARTVAEVISADAIADPVVQTLLVILLK